MTLFNKILIANRGEIACRIIRTAKKLGIKTVAVFSEIDCDSLHVKNADEAYLIGPATSKESYLNINKIITIAKKANVNAIHPGYGFLSENSEFAKACELENINFIGPSSVAIELMANKNIAKEKMEQNSVPILPGFYDPKQSMDNSLNAAKKIGFPIVLKAVAGGGGKGLRLVKNIEEFEHSYHAVKREAKAFFNDDKILLEKYLTHARHIEVQIIGDQYGTIKSLGTRDCSIQRRHQKIIEEAPAPKLSPLLEQKIIAAAIQAGKAINYKNAGTVEFLVEDDNFYFMEMNTRLQVEHPVTEMITDLDIVEWQIRIAAGEKIFSEDKKIKGHAIELRLNAEDPEKDFLPSSGTLDYFNFPVTDHHARIDSGYKENDKIDIYYDSLLAKLIVWSDDRMMTINRFKQFLDQVAIFGIKTNLPLLKSILENKNFQNSNFNTNFLQQEELHLKNYIDDKICITGALFLMLTTLAPSNNNSQDQNSPWLVHDGWQLFSPSKLNFYFSEKNNIHNVQLIKNDNDIHVKLNNAIYDCQIVNYLSLQKNIYQLEIIIESERLTAKIFKQNSKLEIIIDSNHYQLEIAEENYHTFEHDHEEQLLAPMPGTIVALLVNSGQKVSKGDKLIVIEAMKMEHTLYAPKDGIVKECYYKIGDLIKEGSELIEFES